MNYKITIKIMHNIFLFFHIFNQMFCVWVKV